MTDEFDKFRTLLADTYLFPANYTHKFIGKNPALFRDSVLEFEKKFVGLRKVSERSTASGSHLALTYDFIAGSPEDIVELVKSTHAMNDLMYIL